MNESRVPEPGRAMDRRRILALTVAFEGALLLLAWVLGVIFGVPALGSLNPGWGAAGWGLLATLPLLAGLWILERGTWPSVVTFKGEVHQIVSRLFSRCTLLDLAVISILAGVCEEVFFRGLLQRGLSGVVGLGAALVVASALFGLAHAVTLAYAVYAAVVGLYLGALFITFDNLMVPVVIHGAYDFLALTWLVILRPSPGSPAPRAGLQAPGTAEPP
jgi:membrane protease YdiL (CAAX protease family)